MKYYLIDEQQLNAIEKLSKRLHTEARMDGNEMRDAGHELESIARVCHQLELTEKGLLLP